MSPSASASAFSPLPTPKPTSFPSPLPIFLVGVSTKMYFSHARSQSYLSSLLTSKPLASALTTTTTSNNSPPSTSTSTSSPPLPLTLFFIPSFPSLLSASLLIQSPSSSPCPISLGAQDTSPLPSLGPQTGSVSALQLAEIGVSMVEIGHAERRAAPFLESDELVKQKAVAAVKAGLVPLVCVGEKARPREGLVSEGVGKAVEEVWGQCEGVLEGIEGAVGEEGERGGGSGNDRKDGKKVEEVYLDGGRVRRDVLFAYEPVWAIGAEKPADRDHVRAVVGEVKRRTEERWRRLREKEGWGMGQVRVLYGGSAGPGTWEGLKGVVDGLFLGRFAHEVVNVEVVVREMLGGG